MSTKIIFNYFNSIKYKKTALKIRCGGTKLRLCIEQAARAWGGWGIYSISIWYQGEPLLKKTFGKWKKTNQLK